MKKLVKTLLCSLLALCMCLCAAACDDGGTKDALAALKADLAATQADLATAKSDLTAAQAQIDEINATNAAVKLALKDHYAAEAYVKAAYIDKNLQNRDAVKGTELIAAQNWIVDTLKAAGYAENTEVYLQEFEFTSKFGVADDLAQAAAAASSYEKTDKFYKMDGRKYVACEESEATHVDVKLKSNNVVAVKKGKTDKQIIVGAHYDAVYKTKTVGEETVNSTGLGDNGSGLALGLTTAEKFKNIETEYTIVFVFFGAEEKGCIGSAAYANAMTEEEVEKTLYMINMDSIACGDYCYLYGGVQDNENKTVTDTEAFDNAMALADKLGLEFEKNPWTWDNMSPSDKAKGKENPSYASPSTGNWSDHSNFKKKGIKYLYMEASNWYIPDYTGAGETYALGEVMHSLNDNLTVMEQKFPGRVYNNLKNFSTLLNALLKQNNFNL